MQNLYTFDIFDTLVTRKVAVPKGVFDIMQERLSKDERYREFRFVQSEFADLRIAAERQALEKIRLMDGEEVTFQQIYDQLADLLDVSRETVEPLMILEVATEKENLLPIETNLDKIRALVSQGKRVVLISDMYLPKDVLREWMISIDYVFQTIPIYVSSEWNRRKTTGHLFGIVREKEKVPYEKWYHIGDNIKSDVAVPRELGIHARHFVLEPLWRVEKDFLDKYYMKSFAQYALGTARNLRLLNKEKGHPFHFGCTIGGVLLFSYVMWILQACKSRGIRRLYFIARDGYLPKQVADQLIRLGGFSVETHYIHGSRHAWRVPAYDGERGSLRRLVVASQPDKIRSMKDLASLVQLSTDEVQSYLPKGYICKEPFSFEELGECIQYLEESKEFREFLLERHADRKAMAQAYLKQEIDVSDDAFAFVDAGGWGYTQECLAGLLLPIYPKDIRTFALYMGMGGYGKGCLFHNFCEGTYEPFFEPMLRAPHGQTRGYVRDGMKIHPVCREDEGIFLSAYGYEEYIEGILAFCEQFYPIFDLEINNIDVSLIRQFMRIIKKHLGDAEFDFLMDLPYGVTGNETKASVFAPRLTKGDLRAMFFPCGYVREKSYPGMDVSYSLLRCNEREKRKICFYRKHADRLIDRYQRLWKRNPKLPERQIYRICNDSRIGGKRIVLYGAGKYGREVYRLLRAYGNVEVVAWLDRDYRRLQEEGYPVSGNIAMLEQLSYDRVVIGILEVSGSIRNLLMECGVPKDSIVELL